MKERRVYWTMLPLSAGDSEDGNFDLPETRVQVGTTKNPPDTTGEDRYLIGSNVGDNLHLPVLDIDLPIGVRASKTPGHYHLFIDCEPIPWEDYKELLDALVLCGIVDAGYVRASVARAGTFVRLHPETKPRS